MEELTELPDVHGGKTSRGLFRRLALCITEDTSIKSTCTQEQSSLCQEADAEPQVLPSTAGLPEGSIGETGNSSDLLSPAMIAEPCSGSDNSWPWDSSLKEPEEKWEEEELPNTKSAGDGDSDPWSVLLAPLKDKKAEAAASPLAGDPCDDGPSELFPTSEAEENSGFSTSSLSGVTCEERGMHWPAEQSAHSTVLCTETEEASKPLLHIKAEELEELEEDILSSLHEESTLMPYRLCSLTSEPECTLCPALQEKETEPAASPLDSDPCGEGHIEPFPMARPTDPKMLSCTLPANPMEEPDAACMEAGCSQASLAKENPSGPAVLAGACPVSSQALACCVPSPTTNMTTVPQPPVTRQWHSIVKTARRALRRLFSFSCLRGQPEE
ncbi:unnamed protein product [Coccothraustes coccothraustes]